MENIKQSSDMSELDSSSNSELMELLIISIISQERLAKARGTTGLARFIKGEVIEITQA